MVKHSLVDGKARMLRKRYEDEVEEVERQAYARELSLPSARLGVEGSLSYLQAVLEADIADKSVLKDAFMRLRTSNNNARPTADPPA